MKTRGIRSSGEFAPRAIAYAESVVSGQTVVCKWVQRACERFLTDLKRKDIQFDPAPVERFCTFVELLPHIKGKWKTKNIKLEPWQVWIYANVFGFYRKDGTRRFRTVYVEVPRKNAKSTMAAPVGLWMLAADGEPGAEVYSAATTRDQARIVWKIAKDMADKSPGLRNRFGIETYAHSIAALAQASKFEPLSADADSLDGLNVHCAIIDELHAHKTREVFDVLETATGSRQQPLIWNITTAGSNRSGICYEQRNYVTRILDGTAEDDSYFGVIYTIDDGDDWTDPAAWAKANPNYGVSVLEDDIARLARKAQQIPAAQNAFLTDRLNVWVNADTSWMDARAWEVCADPELDLDDFAGEDCMVGIDLASRNDIAALVALFRRQVDGVDKFYLFGRWFLPEETVENESVTDYRGWVVRNRIITTPGPTIDFAFIEETLKSFSKRFHVLEAAYDPYQATQFVTRMIAEGLPMVEMPQNVKNLSEPMKELMALVLSRRLVHDGDPVLSWMVSNVVCHLDAKDNIYPRKERYENKIDGPVAAMMALNRWISRGVDTSYQELFVL